MPRGQRIGFRQRPLTHKVAPAKLFLRDVPPTAAVSAAALVHSVAPVSLSIAIQAVLSSAPSKASAPLGVNLAGFNYSSGATPYLNLVKQAGQQNGNYNWCGWITGTGGAAQGSTNEQQKVNFDPDQYPLQIPQAGLTSLTVYTILSNRSIAPGASAAYPPGTYRLQFTGSGTVVVSGGDVASSLTLSNVVTGKTVSGLVTLSGAGSITYLTITSSNPSSNGDNVRNISLVQNAYATIFDGGQIFHPSFLAATTPFSSLRFMDWLQTNNEMEGHNATGNTIALGATSCTLSSPIQIQNQTGKRIYFNDGTVRTATVTTSGTTTTLDWSAGGGGLPNAITTNRGVVARSNLYISYHDDWTKRALPSNAFYCMYGGIPYEIAIALGNAVGADIHINVPLAAPDSYITSLNQLIHAGTGAQTGGALTASQNCLLELSNEVWNGAFTQYEVASYFGGGLWPAQPTGGGNYYWNANWFGLRTAVMAEIAKTVWGADFGRCIPALGAQGSGTFSATDRLQTTYWTGSIDGYTGPASAHPIKAVAIAPYFGQFFLSTADTTTLLGVAVPLDDFFATLTSQSGTAANGSHAYTSAGASPGGWLGQAEGWALAYKNYLKTNYPSLHLIMYEGGQQFGAGPSSAWNALMVVANRDARMGAAYTTFLNWWAANIGATAANIMHLFNDCWAEQSNGFCWGLYESFMQNLPPFPALPMPPALKPTNAGHGMQPRSLDQAGPGGQDFLDMGLLATTNAQMVAAGKVPLKRINIVCSWAYVETAQGVYRFSQTIDPDVIQAIKDNPNSIIDIWFRSFGNQSTNAITESGTSGSTTFSGVTKGIIPAYIVKCGGALQSTDKSMYTNSPPKSPNASEYLWSMSQWGGSGYAYVVGGNWWHPVASQCFLNMKQALASHVVPDGSGLTYDQHQSIGRIGSWDEESVNFGWGGTWSNRPPDDAGVMVGASAPFTGGTPFASADGTSVASCTALQINAAIEQHLCGSKLPPPQTFTASDPGASPSTWTVNAGFANTSVSSCLSFLQSGNIVGSGNGFVTVAQLRQHMVKLFAGGVEFGNADLFGAEYSQDANGVPWNFGNAAVTLNGSLSNATSGTLATAWGGNTNQYWTLLNGVGRPINYTQGSTAVSWAGALTLSGPISGVAYISSIHPSNAILVGGVYADENNSNPGAFIPPLGGVPARAVATAHSPAITGTDYRAIYRSIAYIEGLDYGSKMGAGAAAYSQAAVAAIFRAAQWQRALCIYWQNCSNRFQTFHDEWSGSTNPAQPSFILPAIMAMPPFAGTTPPAKYAAALAYIG